eukprot:TRINITY_DN7143_c0_g2_i3.p1 TRINITY_DN7143_c0_g2~~TRINITY_DN7143_c0_g2_i3.p1  ORF type:complete len:1635 (+),score=538.63 TRINITY_DN7143_c0_g2_i3:664-4905(+)
MAGNNPPDIIATGAAPQDGDVILEALDAGTRVFGKFVFACEGLTAPDVDDPELVFDDCPDYRYRSICLTQEDEDRLCSKCPLTLSWNGAEVCLWGNKLLPRKKENYLQYTTALPFTYTDGAVIHAAALPHDGCALSDYVPYAGLVLITHLPQHCLLYTAVRLASRAGVAVYISVDPMRDALPIFPDGHSAFVDMPVHTMYSGDYDDLVTAMGGATEANDGVWALNGAALRDGARRAKRNVTYAEEEEAAPPPALPELLPNEVMTGAVVALTVVGAALVAAIAALQVYHSKHMVKIDTPDGQTSIPLGVANTSLSLTLLILTASVAFVLAHTAGQDATKGAQRDGKAAAEATYTSAAENVGNLADQLRSNIIQQVKKEFDNLVADSETAAVTTASMFLALDGTWNAFAEQLPMLADFGQAHLDRGRTIQVFTKQGFYASPYGVTDYRSDAEREDGVVGTVRETNTGWLYGYVALYYNERTLASEFWSAHPAKANNLSHQMNGRPGEPTRLMHVLGRGDFYWMMAKQSVPGYTDGTGYVAQPLSVYTPLYNRNQEYMGVVEVQRRMNSVGTILRRALSVPGLDNMTLVVFAASDTSILASNTAYQARSRGLMVKTTPATMYGTWTMHDIPPVHLKAAANYLSGVADGWEQHRGEFEQKEQWSIQNLTAVRVGVVNGTIEDVTGDASDVELRGGGGGGATDGDREVIYFDGGSTLHIYRNMSMYTPRVYSTLYMDEVGGISSTLDEYSNLIRIPGSSSYCAAYTSYTDSLDGTTECLMKESVLREPFTVSAAIKPDADIPGIRADDSTPLVFTDTRTGDSNIRLFANGEVEVSRLSYGCRTKPNPGGIPGGVWTTITAVINPDRYSCRVYVNGTLVDYEMIADAYSHSEYGEAYLVGQRFRGYMDNVTLFNITLSEAEVMSVHETGELEREVPERDWFIDLETLNKRTNGRFGDVRWGVVAMLPRLDIMRQVDEKNRFTSASLAINEKNAQNDLDRKSRETILLLIVIGLSTVLIFVVFNNALTKPFAVCADLMADAAVMRVDVIPEGRSYLSEINAMNASMAQMLQNLKEFKSYMPQTLQFDSEADADAGETVADVISNGSVAATPSDVSRASSRSARSKSAVGSYVARSMGASNSSSVKRSVGVAHAARLGAAVSLTRKRVSFVVCNVHGWLQQIVGMTDTEVVKLHSSVLSLTLTVFQAHKGISEVFSGDRFVASFNAVRVCAMHRVAAADAALQVKEQAGVMEQPVAFHSSCVSGETRVGNCGNELMKKFSFMAPTFTWAFALERVAAQMEVPILADMFITDEAQQGGVMMKTVADVLFPKRLRKGLIRVSEVWGKRSSGETDEWMYEMQHAERSDPMAPWNAFATHVLNKDWEAAEDAKADAAVVDNGAAFERLAASLAEQVAHPVAVQHH